MAHVRTRYPVARVPCGIQVSMRTTELRGRRMARDSQVRCTAPGQFKVSDGRQIYTVEDYRCNCRAESRDCAHVLAVIVYETQRSSTLFR